MSASGPSGAAAPVELAQALAGDTQARMRALEPASFIVEAPAGAGKTELLTQRLLRLLATVEAPEEVVAITFTNKAAAEMRERVLSALERARRGESPEKPHQRLTLELAQAALAADARRGWDLIGQPARLSILTIDALCASIARQMPLLSRFGAQPAIARDAGALYAEAARETLAQLDAEGEGSDALAAPLVSALAYLDNDAGRLQRLLVGMLARREQWLGKVSVAQESDRALEALVGLELSDIAEAVDGRWQVMLMPLAQIAAANVDAASPIASLAGWATRLPGAPDALPHWQALAELVLTKDGDWRKTVNVRQGFPPGAAFKARKEEFMACLAAGAATPGLGEALARVRDLPCLAGREPEDAIVRDFAALLNLAVAHLWTVFRARAEVDFSEIALRAIAALRDDNGTEAQAGERPGLDVGSEDGAGPSELALRLDYRIRHLLVDEFQDTSPAQVELLERLTEGWTEGDGRTLFCVGDPMQSIYRFRKADVALFLKAAHDGIGSVRLERLALCRNNRSLPAVVGWINDAFAGAFPPADRMANGAVMLRPSVATREDTDAGEGPTVAGVFFHPVPGAGESEEGVGKEDDDRAEAKKTLQLIDAARADPAVRSIAVLVRARTHLAPLVAAIRRERPDLRFQAVEVEALGERPWVADLVTMTRALLHRADRVHWLALLRSPLVGLTLADLCALAEDDRRATLWQLLNDEARRNSLSSDGRARAEKVLSACSEAFAAQGRVGLARWVEGTWLLLGGPATLPDRAAVDDVEALFSLLDELDASGRFDVDRLDAEIGRLFAAPDPAADGVLRLMTIHKSKGLEFDVVILPGLHRAVKGNDPPMLLWDEVLVPGEPPRLVVAPMPPRRVDAVGEGAATPSSVPSAYDFLKDLERQRSRNEDLRVLYVAATRARRTLHLLGVLEITEGLPAHGEDPLPAATCADAAWKAPAAGTPLADLWHVLGPMAGTSPAAHAPENWKLSQGFDFVPAFRRLRSADHIELPAHPGTGRAAGAGHVAEASAPARDAEAAHFGTLAHRYLELIAAAPEAWSPKRLAACIPAMAAWLSAHALAADRCQPEAERLAAMLSRVLASERGRWVLARREGGASELALGRRGAVSVIDRSFVEDGVRWIVDYKTTPTAGLDEAALHALAQVHRPQLEGYASLYCAEGRPIRAAVFFVDGAHWVELALPAGSGDHCGPVAGTSQSQ